MITGNNNNNNNNWNIKSIVKVFAIIELIAANKGRMSLSQISKELNIARSTIHGYASTLMDLGYLVIDQDSGHYELSAKFFELGNAISQNWLEMNVAEKTITELSQKLDETISISRLVDGKVLCVLKRDTPNSISNNILIGEKGPAYCTSPAKCLLSFLPFNDVKSIIKRNPMVQFTENTITDVDFLLEQLHLIRKVGYSIDDEEFIKGVAGISYPIFNDYDEVVAAINVMVSKSKLNDKYLEQIKLELSNAAKKISNHFSTLGSSI